jgi:PAP2 superfamily
MRARLRSTQARLFPHGYLDLVRQVFLFFLAYYAYGVVRGTVDDAWGSRVAFAHGRDVIYLERSLHVFFEPSIQAWAQTKPAIIDAADWIYLNAQTTVTVGALVFIYLFHNARFYFVRNMMITAMALALIGYIGFPTAPPRLFPEWGFVDSVSNFVGVNHAAKVNNLFNPYAAVPSMHVAFALMIGGTLSRVCKHRAVRILWGCYPVLVTFVIVATGNHFISDAIMGAVTAGLSMLVARWLAQRRPAAWAFSSANAGVAA